MRKLPRLVAETKVNTKTNVTIWRNEKIKNIKVTIAEMKENQKVAEKKSNDNNSNILKSDYFSELGITLSNITNDMRMSQNIPNDVDGLLVAKVEQNTDAEIKGIRPGDIIQEVNQTSINSLEEFGKLIKKLKGKRKGILLLINRQGNINFVALKLS